MMAESWMTYEWYRQQRELRATQPHAVFYFWPYRDDEEVPDSWFPQDDD